MNGFSRRPLQAAELPAVSAAEHLRRCPQRVSVTISWHLRQRLQTRADEEGRSLSNLLAFLLENASAEDRPKPGS
jgi:macrodomain Ter protein organizer (MatP/YcbG family)